MTQKELKALYTEELRKAWDDDSMVKHCINSTAYIVEHNGKLYGIEKPRIKKRFCFGYGFCGVSTPEEYEQAAELAEHAATSKEYFISENLSDINEWIKDLQDMAEELGRNWAEGSYPHYMLEVGEHYYRQPEDCKLNYYSIHDAWYNGQPRGELCSDVGLLEKLIVGYEAVKTDFSKRLETYLKRYGLSKIETWSYLSD